MAIPEDRMSTTPVIGTLLAPDERNRTAIVDYEQGPIALVDTSQGLAYQPWALGWDFATGDFTATPETTGSPSVVLNAAAVIQFSFCFDQNAHINIAYTLNGGQTKLYWYDTVAGMHVTTTLPSAVIYPTLTLDDKRTTQTGASDMLLWWTEEQLDGSYTLYRAQQRDRFSPLVKKAMATDVFPYIFKCGMDSGYRVQIGLSDVILS